MGRIEKLFGNDYIPREGPPGYRGSQVSFGLDIINMKFCKGGNKVNTSQLGRRLSKGTIYKFSDIISVMKSEIQYSMTIY